MKNKSILIIENDPKVSSEIKKQFSELGIQHAQEVDDGYLGVQEILRAHKKGKHYDLIISNLRVPKINGFKLATEFRKKIPDANVPFLLMLIEKDKDKIEKVVAGGVKDYILQPFKTEQLKEALKKVWNVSDSAFVSEAANPLVSMGQQNESVANPFAQMKPKEKKKTEVFSFSMGDSKKKEAEKPKKKIDKEKLKISERPEFFKVSTLKDAESGSGSSYAAKQRVVVCEDMDVGPVDRSKPVNGIYFKISYLVHGADKNYFWAEEVEGENLVQMFLLTNSCKKGGMLIETVLKQDFNAYFYASEKYGCELPGYEG